MKQENNLKGNLLSVLESFSNEDRVSDPNSMFNLWDDFYVPQSQIFEESFEPHERESLTLFANELNKFGSCLPQTIDNFETIYSHEEWPKVKKLAQETLVKHGWLND
ncbi:MAG: hypothetical protein DHS20C02_06570 [Micavibrio sp.]|nr:MAG: hypothetical protein DHS20C02_06570 [Micavibrio sp.]